MPPGARGIHGMHLAQAAEANELVAHDEVRFAQTLHAGLVDPLVLGGGRHHGLPLAHGHRCGLLGVDVLPRAHGEDGDAGVPPVPRGGVDRVDVRTRQQLAHVDVRLAVMVSVVVVDDFLHVVTARFPHVADGDKLHVLLRQHPAAHHAAAATTQADAGHGYAVGRRHRAVAPERGGGHEPRQRDRAASTAKK